MIKSSSIFTVLAFCILIAFSSVSVKATTLSEVRLGGANRIETNIKVIDNAFTSSDYVIIASDTEYTEAIIAASISGQYTAPVLLSSSDSLSGSTIAEIKKLGATKAIIVGSTLKESISTQLTTMGLSCQRIAGTDKYDTAIKVANDITTYDTIFLVSGDSFADGMSVAPIAHSLKAPVLLTKSNDISPATLNLLNSENIKKVYVIGGPAVISDSIVASIPTAERIYGSSRYDTNIDIIQKFSSIFDFSTIYLSTGGNFPDALSGSSTGSPVLLTQRIPSTSLKGFIDSIRDLLSTIKVLGGDASLRQYTVDNIIKNTPITIVEAEPLSDADKAIAIAKAEAAKKLAKAQLDAKYNTLSIKIANYLKTKGGTYGFYMTDLTNGETIGYNQDRKFIGASTVKVPINLFIFDLRRRGIISASTKVQYLNQDYETGTGSLQYGHAGGYYTIQNLSKLSIQISDNVAVNMLLRVGFNNNINSYIGGLLGYSVPTWKNSWSAKDMGIFMKAAYDFPSKDKALGNELLGYLEHTIFNDRINRYLPGVVVAHKIGNGSTACNDVGIVYAKHPYVITFMSNNSVNSTSCNVIGTASKMAYDFIQAN
jgi:putative cell wall-binding protein